MLAAMDALAALVAQPHPGSVDKLAELRWIFTRDMLGHFHSLETELLRPLMADRRPEVAAAALRSSQDLASVYGHFSRHTAQWHGLPAREQWEPYRRAVAMLARLMAVRVSTQERTIYSLLPSQPGGRTPVSAIAPINYAAEVWAIRGLIYRDNAARIAIG